MGQNFFKVRNGVNVGVLSADPANPLNGDVYYNSTTNTFREYVNGSWYNTVEDTLAQTLSNKTLDNTTIETIKDSNLTIENSSDITKQAKFSAASISTGTTRTYTLPDISDTLVSVTDTQNLTNKQVSYTSSSDGTTTGSDATLQPFTTGVVRLTNSSLVSVGGIPAGNSGQFLILENQTGNPIVITNEDGSASAANRIQTGASNVTMSSEATFSFTYDTTTSRWQLTSGSSPALSDPMTNEGDMIYQHSGAPTALPIGPAGSVLTSNGTDPSWQFPQESSQTFTHLGTPSQNVRVATTTAGTFNTSFANGQSVDGVTLATNDIILIKSQTNFAFYGTITGTATPVLISANVPGVRLITITFTGSNTITSAITTWNTANPNNTATLSSGTGTQIPSNGTITLGDLNGIYVVNASGAPTRDVQTTPAGLQFFGVHVTSGTTNTNTNWWENNFISTFQQPQSWSQSSTESFTVPAGVTVIHGVACGGGGGGGGGAAGNNIVGGGGGGGAGSVPAEISMPVSPGDILAVTIGLGGVGGIFGTNNPGTSGSPGTAGGFSSIVGGTNGVTCFFPGANGGAGAAFNTNTGAVGGSTYATFSTIYTGTYNIYAPGPTDGGTGGNGGVSDGINGQGSQYSANFGLGGLFISGVAGDTGGAGGGGGSGMIGSASFGGNGANCDFSNAGLGVPLTAGSNATGFGSGGGGGPGGNRVPGDFNSSGGSGGNGAPGVAVLYWTTVA